MNTNWYNYWEAASDDLTYVMSGGILYQWDSINNTYQEVYRIQRVQTGYRIHNYMNRVVVVA